MPVEKIIENETTEEIFDPEKTWGGDESEWIDWRNAERDMTLKDYNIRQIKEMTGEKTKKAFQAVYGSTIKEPTAHMLTDFFLARAGSDYFKRRFFQNRSDVSPKDIEDYYTNHKWEKELAAHEAKQSQVL